MADDEMPYEKAIEETAKAANNTVDLVREGGRAIGPAIGNIYGLLIGDTVAAARNRRLDKTARKTKKILHDRDVREQQELPEDIAIPLLEAAQGEPREELQDLWARLLANAMDPSRSRNVRPEFIRLVQKLEPIDARMLEFLYTKEKELELTKRQVYSHVASRPSAAIVSVDHLIELRCIRLTQGTAEVLDLTEIGTELMIALEA
jgi:hypothetical protein